MRGLDTNILLRYFLQDDPIQAELANRAIATLSVEKPGFVTIVVLCELNWSLRRAYKFSKSQCATILDHVLGIPEFKIERENLCRAALAAYQAGQADFADYLIREVSLVSGCAEVLTFDKAALKSPGFAMPK